MFGIFMAPHTNAATSDEEVISRMNLLIAQGQFNQAYTFGQTRLFDLEGEPEFDFLYGLSALESGRPDSGQKIEDGFMDIGAGFNYNYPFDKNRSAFAWANYNHHNNFSTNTFDLEVLSGETDYAVISDNTRLSLSGRVQKADLDGAEFQSSSWQRNAGNGWIQVLTAAYIADITYTDNDSNIDLYAYDRVKYQTGLRYQF